MMMDVDAGGSDFEELESDPPPKKTTKKAAAPKKTPAKATAKAAAKGRGKKAAVSPSKIAGGLRILTLD